MNPIAVQSTEHSIQVTFDKTLMPFDSLMEFLNKLQLEYLAKEIDFSEEIIRIGENIKQDWWQHHKHEFLKDTVYGKSRH